MPHPHGAVFSGWLTCFAVSPVSGGGGIHLEQGTVTLEQLVLFSSFCIKGTF